MSNIPASLPFAGDEVDEAKIILTKLFKQRQKVESLQKERDRLAEVLCGKPDLLPNLDIEDQSQQENAPMKRYTFEGLSRNILRHMNTISME